VSHTTKINAVTIRSVTALTAAIAFLQSHHKINCTLVPNSTPRAYYAQQEGMGQADYVLKLNDAPYDIGFYKQADGTFEPRTDFWNKHVEKVLGVPHDKTYTGDGYKLGKLMQAYGMAAAEEQARRQGLMVQRSIQANGSIKLIATGFG
jgi:hypothetical protein